MTQGRKPTPCPDDAKLRELVAGGAALANLMEHFGVGPKAAKRWLRERGLKASRYKGNVFTSQHRTWRETSTQEKIDALFTPEQRARFWALVTARGGDECWLWNGNQTHKHGYGQHSVRGRSHRAHRVAYMLAKGPIGADLHVMHSCNTRLCCNPAHLSAGTIQENLAHREKFGNPAKAMRCGRRKLRADQVYAIRESDEHPNVLGTRYGVHPSCIGEIRRRSTWASLPERDPVTKEILVETSVYKSPGQEIKS